MAKTLVTYFSATGTTARVAKAVASELGADLAELAPAAEWVDGKVLRGDRAARDWAKGLGLQ